jgi:hypothetical protein
MTCCIEQSPDMPKEPVCFSTWYVNPVHDKNQMIRSLRYFHPDIPVEVYGIKDVERLITRDSRLNGYWVFAEIGKELSKKYERVIHLDCDIIVTGKLDELINMEANIIAPRNNNDYGLSGGNRPIITDGVEVQEYVNAGTHVITRPEIWDKWIELNDAHGYQSAYFEQDTLNKLMKLCNGVVIDPIEKPYYYGLATSWVTGEGYPYSSWKMIDLNEKGELILNGKKVYMLHRAGGGQGAGVDFKFLPNLFKREVWERLMEITA